MKIVFMGTPDFAAASLAELLACGHEILAVYTQPDRPSGRGNKLKPSAVKLLAEQHRIPVYQPQKVRAAQSVTELATLQPEIIIVVAYGQLLPQAILDIPKYGCLNVHGSILPQYRGASPIHQAIMDGQTRTGVTIMQMDVGLDTGDMLLKTYLPIEDNDTSASLYEKLAEQGPVALLQALEGLANGTLAAEKQDEALANYAEKLSKEEARLDWNKSAKQLWQEVRAFNPWPVSYFEHQGNTIKVWQTQVSEITSTAAPGTIISASKKGIDVATADGVLTLLSMQLPGKKPLNVADILNARGEWFSPNTRLANEAQ